MFLRPESRKFMFMFINLSQPLFTFTGVGLGLGLGEVQVQSSLALEYWIGIGNGPGTVKLLSTSKTTPKRNRWRDGKRSFLCKLLNACYSSNDKKHFYRYSLMRQQICTAANQTIQISTCKYIYPQTSTLLIRY